MDQHGLPSLPSLQYPAFLDTRMSIPALRNDQGSTIMRLTQFQKISVLSSKAYTSYFFYHAYSKWNNEALLKQRNYQSAV
jgi:hypothetical protein